MSVPLTEIGTFVEGATLIAARAVALENEKAAADKAAADERAGLTDALVTNGVLAEKQRATADQLMSTHAGSLQLLKWAAEQLIEERKTAKVAALTSLGQPAAPARTEKVASTGSNSLADLRDRQRAVMQSIHDDPTNI